MPFLLTRVCWSCDRQRERRAVAVDMTLLGYVVRRAASHFCMLPLCRLLRSTSAVWLPLKWRETTLNANFMNEWFLMGLMHARVSQKRASYFIFRSVHYWGSSNNLRRKIQWRWATSTARVAIPAPKGMHVYRRGCGYNQENWCIFVSPRPLASGSSEWQYLYIAYMERGNTTNSRDISRLGCKH